MYFENNNYNYSFQHNFKLPRTSAFSLEWLLIYISVITWSFLFTNIISFWKEEWVWRTPEDSCSCVCCWCSLETLAKDSHLPEVARCSQQDCSTQRHHRRTTEAPCKEGRRSRPPRQGQQSQGFGCEKQTHSKEEDTTSDDHRVGRCWQDKLSGWQQYCGLGSSKHSTT